MLTESAGAEVVTWRRHPSSPFTPSAAAKTMFLGSVWGARDPRSSVYEVRGGVERFRRYGVPRVTRRSPAITGEVVAGGSDSTGPRDRGTREAVVAGSWVSGAVPAGMRTRLCK
jgi:hypothetical protein